MEQKIQLKLWGYSVSALLILNIGLFAFRIIDWKIFWTVVIVGALFVYVVLPRMKK